MTTPDIIRLILQILVGLAWGAMLIKTVAAWRGRSADQGTSINAQVAHWMKSDADRQDRKTLFFLTFVLFAMIATDLLLA